MLTDTSANPARAAIAAIVDLASVDLPEAAGLGAIALMSHDDEVTHAMLRRVYVLALECERSYLAELADDALRLIESTPAFSGTAPGW